MWGGAILIYACAGAGASKQPAAGEIHRWCFTLFFSSLELPHGRRLLLSAPERQLLKVSMNQLPVPDVVFPERTLQRVLFSKNVLVNDSCHNWK